MKDVIHSGGVVVVLGHDFATFESDEGVDILIALGHCNQLHGLVGLETKRLVWLS